MYGLLGPNGAGKTSLVRQLIGLLRRTAAASRCSASDVTGRPDLVSRHVAYLAQTEPALDELTVRVAVDTTARLRGLTRARATVSATDSLIAELGLESIADRPLTRLSGGQRRLAGVADRAGRGPAGAGPRRADDRPRPAGPTCRVGRAAPAQGPRRHGGAGHPQRARGGDASSTGWPCSTAAGSSPRTRPDGSRRWSATRCASTWSGARTRRWTTRRWRGSPATAIVTGRRWTTRMSTADAREALGRLTGGPAFAALDDFTLATPSLEDVYLTLGGAARDLERTVSTHELAAVELPVTSLAGRPRPDVGGRVRRCLRRPARPYPGRAGPVAVRRGVPEHRHPRAAARRRRHGGRRRPDRGRRERAGDRVRRAQPARSAFRRAQGQRRARLLRGAAGAVERGGPRRRRRSYATFAVSGHRRHRGGRRGMFGLPWTPLAAAAGGDRAGRGLPGRRGCRDRVCWHPSRRSRPSLVRSACRR